MIHGKASSYNKGCHCTDCTRAHRYANAERSGAAPHGETFDYDWLILNVPIAVIMRRAFTDEAAIAVAATMP